MPGAFSAHSLRVKLASLLRLSAGVIVGLLAVFVLGIALYAGPTDPVSARAAASRDLRMRALEQGERIEYVLPVHRRSVWDYFTPTHGLLVATDRRLLFIGLPPTIRAGSATEGEPPLIEELAFSYDDVRPTIGRVFLGQAQGIVLRTPKGKERFGIESATRADADSLMRIIRHHQEELRGAAEREQAMRDEMARRARAPICHLVRRGEALDPIATRYNTTADAIAMTNGLRGSRIRAGDTLLVRGGDRADAGGKRCELPGTGNLSEWGFGVAPATPSTPEPRP